MSEYIKSFKSIYRTQRVNFRRNYYTLFGSKDYQKFIIITYARTGSNLLMSYLDSHKMLEARGELFRDIRGSNSRDVWNNFFSKKSKNIKFAGFKLFYTHPFHTDDKAVWDIIANDKDIRIIHLVRKNKIRTYLSGEIAKKTDRWTRKGNNSITLDEKRIEIDFDNFFGRLDDIDKYENRTREDYKNHQFIEICYEDLVSNKDKTLNKVYNFLGVTTKSAAKSNYKKQNSESLKELIMNFDQFNSKVKGSKYSYLLDLEK